MLKKKLVFAFAACAAVSFAAVSAVVYAIFDPDDTAFYNPNP